MTFSFIDKIAFNLYNIVGRTPSRYEAKQIIKKIQSVENTPAGIKLMQNTTLHKLLANKALKTSDVKLRYSILRIMKINFNLSERLVQNINVMAYTEEEKSPEIISNKKDDTFLDGNILSKAELKYQDDALKILQKNRNKLLFSIVKEEVNNKGLSLKSGGGSSASLILRDYDIAVRKKEVCKILKVAEKINDYQACFNNKPNNDELVPENQKDYFDKKTKDSYKTIMEIDKKYADRKEINDIIDSCIFKSIPSEESKQLMKRYDSVKIDDSQTSDDMILPSAATDKTIKKLTR